jgi:hypothetical protein
MRKSLTRQRVAQCKLFHPPQKRPARQLLPPEVRGKAERLLARLLREHIGRVHVSGGKKGRAMSDRSSHIILSERRLCIFASPPHTRSVTIRKVRSCSMPCKIACSSWDGARLKLWMKICVGRRPVRSRVPVSNAWGASVFGQGGSGGRSRSVSLRAQQPVVATIGASLPNLTALRDNIENAFQLTRPPAEQQRMPRR